MSQQIERPIDFTGPRTLLLAGLDSQVRVDAPPPRAVFLKAVPAVRNLGRARKDFTTVNFGLLDHYRPWVAAALLEREP